MEDSLAYLDNILYTVLTKECFVVYGRDRLLFSVCFCSVPLCSNILQ